MKRRTIDPETLKIDKYENPDLYQREQLMNELHVIETLFGFGCFLLMLLYTFFG